MTHPRFNILNSKESTPSQQAAPKSSLPLKNTRRQEFQARFDRLWLLDPKHFDATKNNRERERIARTLDLILRHMNLEGIKVADLGCGSGELTRQLAARNTEIDAVDISSNALKELQKHEMVRIHAIQDFVPSTTLQENHYDCVISTELIAYLPEELYRLYFSELSRLAKLEGWIVCSTSIDIGTQEGVQRFISLAETEIHLHECILSYHKFAICLADFLKAPSRFIKAATDAEYRKKELENRSSVSRSWFWFNSTRVGNLFWRPVKFLCSPLVQLVTQNRNILLALEKLCRALCGENGISHIIILGKRKPLFTPEIHTSAPEELKHKKQLWE